MNTFAEKSAEFVRGQDVTKVHNLTEQIVCDVEERWVAGESLSNLASEIDVKSWALKGRLRERGWLRPLDNFDKEICI